jgi:AcrR family transcriptional regulator
MPRSYRLGERAAAVQATRLRIIEAAIELYTEVGISGATLREIGRRADVAPGTLRNHFPSRDDLDRAMIERLEAEAPLPELTIYDGATTIEERLARLILVGGTFIEQAERIYRMWLRERMLTEPWLEAGARYGSRWSELMQAALGPLADDGEAMAVLQAILDVPMFDTLRGRGARTTEEAARLITDVVVQWFAARARQRPSAARPRRSSGRPDPLQHRGE